MRLRWELQRTLSRAPRLELKELRVANNAKSARIGERARGVGGAYTSGRGRTIEALTT